ncbi:MAG: hypothetical protein ABR572_01205 [Cryomorphaceae bacterium]|nr:hypothetical protein [Flavobacteriales bacterium]
MAKPKKYISREIEFYEDDRGFYYLRTAEGEDITEEAVVRLNDWLAVHRADLKEDRKPMLIELAYGSTISAGVQSFLADSEHRLSTADAILINTFAHKLMATFYLRHYKPQLPTRVFSDVFQALDWIEKQINDDAVAGK